MRTIAGVFVFLFSTFTFAANDSVYTSIDSSDCVTIADSKLNPNAEIDYYTGHCKGFNEYAVVISGGDLRYNLSLLYQGTPVTFQAPQGFYEPGSKNIEWRGAIENGAVTQFHSLIYRLNVEYLGANGKNVNEDHLYVIRLAGKGSCLIGDVGPSASMNAEARNIADDMSLICP